MRAFLALPIPVATLDALVAAQSRLAVGRPVPEENMHLTLAFLGEVSAGSLEELDDILSATPLPTAPVNFGGLGTFGDMERGLVFVSVQAGDRLASLQTKVARAARVAGIELPRRRFRPHVTLTRSNRQPVGPARDRLAASLGAPVEIPGFDATELVLFQSTLGPSGARHDPLSRYPLSPMSG
jgi:2'-5' RNA ligase